ncbi:MAG: hypothetical protein NTW86_05845 [Candidatus Sumerlaeota bacterium]|nr:hypothetical protein [Candidatus Sumerlaeota bacterium]
MNPKMAVAVFVGCLMVWPLAGTGNAEEFVIDYYTFTWHVAKVGGIEMDINKEEGGVSVYLHGDFSMLTATPADAAKIGKALQKAGEYFNKLKDAANNTSVREVAGPYEVTFSESERGFSVYITRIKGFGDRLFLDHMAAVEIAKVLVKSEEMAAFLDKRVNPSQPVSAAGAAKERGSGVGLAATGPRPTLSSDPASSRSVTLSADQAQVETFLATARRLWGQNDYGGALQAAQEALAIQRRILSADFTAIANIEAMVQQAKKLSGE